MWVCKSWSRKGKKNLNGEYVNDEEDDGDGVSGHLGSVQPRLFLEDCNANYYEDDYDDDDDDVDDFDGDDDYDDDDDGVDDYDDGQKGERVAKCQPCPPENHTLYSVDCGLSPDSQPTFGSTFWWWLF